MTLSPAGLGVLTLAVCTMSRTKKEFWRLNLKKDLQNLVVHDPGSTVFAPTEIAKTCLRQEQPKNSAQALFFLTLSTPQDSNLEPPRYKLGALTIELGVVCYSYIVKTTRSEAIPFFLLPLF